MKRSIAVSIAVMIVISTGGSAALAQAPAGATYLTRSDGTILSILASGETYRSAVLIGGGLAPTVHLGNFWEAVAGTPIDPMYEMHESGVIVAIDADGNVYQGGIADSLMLETAFIGSYWEAVAGLPIDPVYEMHESGIIIAIDADGNVYQGGMIAGVGFIPAVEIGYFWEGITATRPSSWGTIKGLKK